MREPTLGLIQMAAKAGKLSFGTHATEWAIKSGKARLAIAANDISDKSVKELKFNASKVGVTVLILHYTDIEALSKAIGKKCGIIAVNDESFSKAIIEKDLGGTAHDGKI